MDAEILHALWFDCHDLNDIERTLLQALAYHGSPCWPSVKRLSVMIRRTHRHTQRLLTQLEKKGYIIILVRRGRGHSNLYTINMTSKRHILGKIRHPGDVSKYDIQVSSELKEEQERKKEELLSHLGLTKGSAIWVAALNGQRNKLCRSVRACPEPEAKQPPAGKCAKSRRETTQRMARKSHQMPPEEEKMVRERIP